MKEVIYKDWFDGWKKKTIQCETYTEENGYSFFKDLQGMMHKCLTKDVMSVESKDEIKHKAAKQ